MSKLILIDGFSCLYRAFHALPPLTNRQGEPTGALFGVMNMLRTTLNVKPDYAAFVSDASGPTFRHELYPPYKANRPPMPQALQAQVEPMLTMVGALGLPMLRVAGLEADDVIGTLALKAHHQGMLVEIYTLDKDMAQLVRPGITLVNTMTDSMLDEAGVLAKFGVPPGQIIDFLALTGDASDNIPGVYKCGAKTAARWLAQYGSLDGVIENASQLSGKIGQYLRDALPQQLPLARKLVTIKTDAVLDTGPTDLLLRDPDLVQLREFCIRYDFKTIWKELESHAVEQPALATSVHAVPAPSPPSLLSVQTNTHLATPGTYELITTLGALDAWLEKLACAPLVAFDTETTGTDPMRADIVGISLAVEVGKACYIPLDHTDLPPARVLDCARVLAKLKPVLENPRVMKLGQHAKYDINILARYGITVCGLKHDTMLESYVWDAAARGHNMDALARTWLGYQTLTYEEVVGKGTKQIPFTQLDSQTACRYAAEDADITLRLHHVLWPKLKSRSRLRQVYEDIEIPLVPVLARMERYGVLIDVTELNRQNQQLGERMNVLHAQMQAQAGHAFNPDSPRQLQTILFDRLGLPVRLKTPKGQPSTNEEALEAIADLHVLPQLILDYRRLAKLRSTYTGKLPGIVNPRTGRVHTSYHQGAVATGRLSSSDPNLQNIPVRTEEGRRIRQAFVAPEGWLMLAADYSQIELRIMTHLSGDTNMLNAFRAGGDIHRTTAAEVFHLDPEQVSTSQRRAAKAINFGLIYGMSAFGLARQLGVSRDQASDYMSRYFSRYPGVHAFMETTRTQAHRHGYVETLFGRRLYLNNLRSPRQSLRQGAQRAAVNAPMQGTAADIIKRAMITMAAWLDSRDDAHLLMQVHDELVFEVRVDAVDRLRAAVCQHMEGAAQLIVPLRVDVGVGANWEQAH